MQIRLLAVFALMSGMSMGQTLSIEFDHFDGGYLPRAPYWVVVVDGSHSIGSLKVFRCKDFGWMETSMDTTILMDRLMNSVAEEEVFERPLGPHPDCFSTSQVVRMFESGAAPEELAHMFTCAACNDVVARSSRLARMLEVETSPPQAQGFGQAVRELILGASAGKSMPDVAALVGLSDPVMEVEHPDRPLSVTLELLPGIDPNEIALDAGTLRLDGAATSASASLERSCFGTGQLHRVTFSDARLSQNVKNVLANHRSVADELSVSGVLRGSPQRTFLGKARVEFVQSRKSPV